MNFGVLDWIILAVYFVAMASIGPLFARKNKSAAGFFVGNREFPAWLLGLAMFATSISSVTVVASPGDSYKAAYLRLLPSLMLPVGIFIAAKVFLPYFRRNQCTSAFEFLEGRFGPGIRVYAASAFLVGQLLRISSILYLVSLVFQVITGASPNYCIFIGGLVVGIYTVAGGIRAILWAQFVQSFLLWLGAFLCLYTVLQGIDGGLAKVFSVGFADHKFMFGDLNAVTKQLEPAPWFSLHQKAIIMMLVVGLFNWLTEYSSNQNVIQKYVAAKDPREATRSIWICCFLSVPTWCFFMFLGTCLYVFFQEHPSPKAYEMLTGLNGAKAESILPYFCVQNLPSGVAGLVITGILAAAMSATSSSVSAISAIGITDIYRRHLVKSKEDRHYLFAARMISAATAILMMGGAWLFYQLSTLTLADLTSKLTGILAGGLLGLYTLGFLTKRGDGRAAAVGIVCCVLFSLYLAMTEFLPAQLAAYLTPPCNIYYGSIFGNIIMFVVGYGAALCFPRRNPA